MQLRRLRRTHKLKQASDTHEIHHYQHYDRGKRSIGQEIDKECYPAGTITSTDRVRLSHECSVSIDLGEDFFPRYINELTCDSSNLLFFGGEGVCETRHQSYTFLKNVGAPNYEAVPVNFGVGCHCELYQGSPFIGFL